MVHSCSLKGSSTACFCVTGVHLRDTTKTIFVILYLNVSHVSRKHLLFLLNIDFEQTRTDKLLLSFLYFYSGPVIKACEVSWLWSWLTAVWHAQNCLFSSCSSSSDGSDSEPPSKLSKVGGADDIEVSVAVLNLLTWGFFFKRQWLSRHTRVSIVRAEQDKSVRTKCDCQT